MHMLALCLVYLPQVLLVQDSASFREALSRAVAGTEIRLEPGEYAGAIHVSNIHGTAEKPIMIRAADPANPPRIVGGGSALQLSSVSHLVLQDLIIQRPQANGLNIDDGGSLEKPSHHITIKNVRVQDVPQGNRDGIKLSGVDHFQVEQCTVERWGGSAIDMVGCHNGVITGCTFRSGGDNAVQTKGGSSGIEIVKSRFENAGQRAVNIGGSTGRQFFRPPLSGVPEGSRYEAKEILVESCTFIGSMAPIAFVGADGAVVRYNTIYNPGRWVIRILQETATPDFVPCREGRFERNLVVFSSGSWASGGVNIGAGTAPQTFKFLENFWFCSDRPGSSRPTLPVEEAGGVYGQDPLFKNAGAGDLELKEGSSAKGYGARLIRG